ncbi:MAG: ABC transporter permease [Peptoniphilaceae bacterium]
MNNIPKLPVAEWVKNATKSATSGGKGFFNGVREIGEFLINNLEDILISIPPVAFIVVLTFLALFLKRKSKKWGFGVFVFLGLVFVQNQGLWTDFISTLSLILVASLFAIVIGVPLGILAGKNDIVEAILKPILDFMQTMPAFVYLIPAVAFFGIGVVPGMVASIIFALPPTVRFTSLGLRQISKELEEAAISFGSTPMQRLFKVELPLAKSTIMAGINQTVMLSLSMVVIASMIGAPGLGRRVVSALQRSNVGAGFVSGLSIVVLAIIMDRFTQIFSKDKRVK